MPSLPSLISYPNCPNSPINGTYEPGLQVAMRIDTDVCSALYFYCKLSPCAPLSQLRSTLKQRRKLWVFDGGRGRGEVELANVILQKQRACVCVCVCVCYCLCLSVLGRGHRLSFSLSVLSSFPRWQFWTGTASPAFRLWGQAGMEGGIEGETGEQSHHCGSLKVRIGKSCGHSSGKSLARPLYTF